MLPGNRLREWRQAAALSMNEVAAKVGVSRPAYQHEAGGFKNPPEVGRLSAGR